MPLRIYNCHWCGNRFEAMATYTPGEVKGSKRVHHGSGNQIKCPKCQRLIPKFPVIRLENGSHIHVRG